MRRVAVVGSNQTTHEPRKADKNVEDMIYETVRGLLDSLGLERDSVDTVIGAGDDVLDGRSISNVFTAEYAGAFLKEESKVESDGAFAASYGFMRIAAGTFDTALIYGYSKASDSSPEHYSGMIADPFYLRPLGIEATSAAAIQAQCYFNRYGATEKDAAQVAVRDRDYALRNPYLKIEGRITVEDVLGSQSVASPIKELDRSPVTDGCCALLLASEEAVKRFNLKPAWIRGVGFSTDTYYPGHRDLAESRSAQSAAERAYKMAGITDPATEVEAAELHGAFSYQELMLAESLGFCEKGGGARYFRETNGLGEKAKGVALNLSGGALSADPIFATGLIRLAEASALVTGRAEEFGMRATTAAAHATSGFCLQSNIVYVVSGEEH